MLKISGTRSSKQIQFSEEKEGISLKGNLSRNLMPSGLLEVLFTQLVHKEKLYFLPNLSLFQVHLW